MSKRQTPLYATQNDLVNVAKSVCTRRPIEFSVMGLFDNSTPDASLGPDALRPFTNYLVYERGELVVVRPVPQRNGSVKYSIDTIENRRTMVLHCGGLIENARLVASDVSAATNDKAGEEIYSAFFKVIRGTFEKIQSYYVGPEALDLFENGVRLTPTAKSPAQYDLAR